MDNTKEFYSIAEVAERLGLSIKTIRRHIAAGNLGSIKVGNVYRIPKAAFSKFINTNPKINDDSNRNPVQYDTSGDVVNSDRNDSSSDKDLSHCPNWVDISKDWGTSKNQNLTFVDLFCGAGGLSKGLEMAGLDGVCGLDWFKEAGLTYRRNFHHNYVEGDITLPAVKKEFYDAVKDGLKGRRLTVVAGGFPCQGFSMAGNRIVDDPRNSLYKEMLEIVKKLQPEYVICENVVGLRTMLNGEVERKILSDFEKAGYKMNVTTLCAADYYTPQKRQRVIFIGNRIGATNYHPKPILTKDCYKTTREAISDLMDHPVDPGFNHVPTSHRPDMVERMRELPEGQSLYKGYSDAWKKCPWNEASCTIKENHGGVNIHPKLPRVLTAREMARLQSFPDDFIFEGKKNKQLVQIGNAVPPLLGKAIGLAIQKSYSEKNGEKD